MRKGKKIAAAVCSLALCAALVGTSAPAIPVSAEQVLQSSGSVKPVSNTVTLDVKLTQNPGVTLVCVWVEYDTANLTYSGAEDENAFKASSGKPETLFYADKAADGKIALMWLNGFEDFSTTGSIAKLTFNVTGEAKEKYNFKVYTETYSTYDIALTEKDVKVDFTKDGKKGDVDGNGKINALDLLAIRKYMVTKDLSLLNNNFDAADVDGNGKVNAMDLLAIRKYMVNKSDPVYSKYFE